MTGLDTAAIVRMAGLHGLGAADVWQLFAHFCSLSLLMVGGAISASPDMHRYLVDEHHWLTDAQFTASIALAQSAPGPNVLFAAVLGWNTAGVAGVLATMVGLLLPSGMLTWAVGRWGQAQKDHPVMQILTGGLAPLAIGLLWSSGWVLTDPIRSEPGAYVLILITLVLSLRTRWSPLWLIALGGLVGALGLV